MTDLNNSVIMPREDFIELSTVAFDNNHVPTIGERTAQVTQTTLILGALAGAVVGAAWGVAKVNDWLETRQQNRRFAEIEFNKKNQEK